MVAIAGSVRADAVGVIAGQRHGGVPVDHEDFGTDRRAGPALDRDPTIGIQVAKQASRGWIGIARGDPAKIEGRGGDRRPNCRKGYQVDLNTRRTPGVGVDSGTYSLVTSLALQPGGRQ